MQKKKGGGVCVEVHLVQVLVQRLPVVSEVVVNGFHQYLFQFTIHLVNEAQCLSTPCEIICE
jgi:hypothetical protein